MQWFRKPVEERGALNTALYTRLLRRVKDKMVAGAARPCLSALLWEVGPSPELSETEMAYFAAMPFAAGTSTVKCFRGSLGSLKTHSVSSQTFGSLEIFLRMSMSLPSRDTYANITSFRGLTPAVRAKSTRRARLGGRPDTHADIRR